MIDLWLDDKRDPADPEIQEMFNASPEMVWVKTADAAISRLRRGQVQFISLDHDLGTTQTGCDVARWIAKQACRGTLPRLNWSVHSENIRGTRAIRKLMEDADRYWSLSEAGEPPGSRVWELEE